MWIYLWHAKCYPCQIKRLSKGTHHPMVNIDHMCSTTWSAISKKLSTWTWVCFERSFTFSFQQDACASITNHSSKNKTCHKIFFNPRKHNIIHIFEVFSMNWLVMTDNQIEQVDDSPLPHPIAHQRLSSCWLYGLYQGVQTNGGLMLEPKF